MPTTPTKPLCFVLMPFGIKKDPATGLDIDFNDIYEKAISVGIGNAEMQPIRADQEQTGGIIHKPMFERLMLCDYAVADLTTANANVFYELGVRHAVRPATTLAIYAGGTAPPFDVNYLRTVMYALGEKNRFDEDNATALAASITKRLKELKEEQVRGEVKDSPIFQLLADYSPPDVARLKTDVFRERAEYAENVKQRLTRARSDRNRAEVEAVEKDLGPLETAEAGVLVDLFLSYRAIENWQAMVDLFARMPAAVKRSVMVREQYGFALNRLGRRAEAIDILEQVLKEQGDSSETCGLIGRVHKDRWAEAKVRGEIAQAGGHLRNAIAMYRRGFDADIRDAYPGINAVTLLDVKGDPESLTAKAELLSVVRYAVCRRLRSAKPDYWDHATLLELAVLGDDRGEAETRLMDALAAVREPWEPKTTANNLKMIRESRAGRGADVSWLDAIVGDLEKAGG